MNLRRFLRPILRVVSIFILVLLLAVQASAAVGPGRGAQVLAAAIVVTTYADELNDDGDCSLREAVQAANEDSGVDACPAGDGADIVTLTAGTYFLALEGGREDDNASGDLDIRSEITFNGAGRENTIIDGQRIDRLLQIHFGGVVELNSLTLQHGQTPVFSGNSGNGGGILNSGELTINDCRLNENRTGAVVFGSEYDGSGSGGAIAHYGEALTISDSILSGNHTGTGGDGYEGGGSGYGGAIFIYDGPVVINNSILSGNHTGTGGSSINPFGAGASGHGGAIYNSRGSLTINGSVLSGNFTGSGGRIESGYTLGWSGFGGAVYSGNGPLTITDSSLSRNFTNTWGSGGGVYARNLLVLHNSTVTGNISGYGGLGGGIRTLDTAHISSSTVTGNLSGDVTDGGGGIHNSGALDLKNSIIFGNTDDVAVSDNDDCYSGNSSDDDVMTSLGYNLTAVGTGCPSDGTGDQTTDDARVASFDQEGPAGGGTHLIALLAGSPAIDAIPDGVNDCGTELTSDQRGYARPQNGACDIGAYEAVYSRSWDSGDGDWSAKENWSGDERPEEGDQALLNSAADINLDISPSIGDLSISHAGANLSAGAGYSMLLNGSLIQGIGSFTAPPMMTVYGDWTRNGGLFSANGGLVRFHGPGVRAIGGTSTTSFHDLLINLESGGELDLDRAIEVSGDFTLVAGTFDPQTHEVTFNGSGAPSTSTAALAVASEPQVISGGPAFYDAAVASGAAVWWPDTASATNSLSNEGMLLQTGDVNGTADVHFLDTGGYGGLIVNANDLDLGSTEVRIAGNQDCTSVAGETVQRCFEILPENSSGRSAAITFFFADGEITAGNSCETLDVFHWNGADWDPLAPTERSCDGELNWVKVEGISDFSRFVLKTGMPTAVPLTGIDGRPALGTVARNISLSVFTALVMITLGGWRFVQGKRRW